MIEHYDCGPSPEDKMGKRWRSMAVICCLIQNIMCSLDDPGCRVVLCVAGIPTERIGMLPSAVRNTLRGHEARKSLKSLNKPLWTWFVGFK